MNCIKCGAYNDEGAAVCKYCGESMGAGADTASHSAVKRRKKGLIIGIAAAVLIMAATAAVLLLSQNTANINAGIPGNTRMNITNGGLAAESGGWIYYCNGSDEGYLYKIRTDGTDKMKLAGDGCRHINVAGDWVYYVVLYGEDHNSICRVRTDGTDREVIYKDALMLYVCGDWIYYSVHDAEAEGGGKTCKMRLDGTEGTDCDWIRELGPFNEIDGWIYFNSQDGRLSKACLKTSETQVLSGDDAQSINVADGWVYYINASDGESVYKVRTDGTERTKLNDDNSMGLSIAGGWIYYTNISEDNDIYRMKTDGSENKQVE